LVWQFEKGQSENRNVLYMTEIPLLHTSRLKLRRMTFEDWLPYATCMQSERAKYMGGPFTTTAAWGVFCSDHAQWDFCGCGALMIEDQQTGLCLGQVGINSGPLFPEHELGWLVFPKVEGQGIAFEAATALRNWAQQAGAFRSLVSYVDPQNERSRRLAERLGATQDDTAAKPDPTDIVYRHF